VDAIAEADALMVGSDEDIGVVEIPYHKVPRRITFRTVMESAMDLDFAFYWDGVAAMTSLSVRNLETNFLGGKVFENERRGKSVLLVRGDHTLLAVVSAKEMKDSKRCSCSRKVRVY
jgi:hypothetical protein